LLGGEESRLDMTTPFLTLTTGHARNVCTEHVTRHVGEVEVRPDDLVGLAVSIAKRICDPAAPREVFVSEGVRGQPVEQESLP
jgi:hypothetical protein